MTPHSLIVCGYKHLRQTCCFRHVDMCSSGQSSVFLEGISKHALPLMGTVHSTNNCKYIYSPVICSCYFLKPTLARNVFKQYTTPCPLILPAVLKNITFENPSMFALHSPLVRGATSWVLNGMYRTRWCHILEDHIHS